MKVAKYLLILVFAFCAFTSITNAQATFLGAGSSALFQELGQGAFNRVNGLAPAGNGCLWTSDKTTANPPGSGADYFAARDGRDAGIIANNGDENGKIFFAWNANGGSCASPTAGFELYVYIQLDSTLGDRCYFEKEAGAPRAGCALFMLFNSTPQVDPVGAGQITTQNEVPGGISLPTAVINRLAAPNNRFFVAGTDIRPEDALFATQRALKACNVLMPRQFFNDVTYDLPGWGFQNPGGGDPANVGVQILGNASFGGSSFNVVNFNITGSDPISGQALSGSFSVTTVGAQPILVGVAPIGDGQVNAMTDITAYTLAGFYNGSWGRATDLLGPTIGEPMTVIVREPLSGTFNTFEYSIPQSTQFHAGQESGNCNASGQTASNPESIPGPGGVGSRVRAIGTGNVTKFLDLANFGTPDIGYFFWSAGNVAKLAHTKYLKVNGIDPLQDQTVPGYSYTGLIPGSLDSGAPGVGVVTFKGGLNAGDYPIWSALRLVSDSPVPAGVTNMINALNALTQNDFIQPSAMNIWHSHFQINGQPPNANNGPLFCAGSPGEGGGDVGGSTMLGINDTHFCSDFGSTQGRLNFTF